MARGKYPDYPDSLLTNIKIDHAMEWCTEPESEKAKLYDQYIMMKRLMDISPNTKN